MRRLSGAESAVAGGAIVVLVLAWANALQAGFQFDDWNVIVADPRVQSFAAWWASMPGIRPLLKLSYAANHELAPGALGFHAVNLAIHAVNALLVFALLSRWRTGEGNRRLFAAAVAALVFALHPVQTEAVTYASGRSASLAALLTLASLLTWIVGRERGRAAFHWLVSPLFFALALAVRETTAVLPLALLLWHYTGGSTAGGGASALRATAPHWLVLALAVVATLATPDYRPFFAASLAAREPVAQLLTQVNALGWLAGQLVRPDRLNADPMLPVATALSPALALRAAAIVAVIVLALARIRRRPAIAFAILWFFLWLAPTNSLLPRLDVANDRQLYLALLGPAWLAGLALEQLARRRRTLALGLGAIVVLALAASTAARNAVYRDEVRFWTDVTAKTPGNSRAWSNLGYAQALAGHTDEAERSFRRALAADARNTRAAVNLQLLRAGLLVERPERASP